MQAQASLVPSTLTRRISGEHAQPSANPILLPINPLDVHTQEEARIISAYNDFLDGLGDFFLNQKVVASYIDEIHGQRRFMVTDERVAPEDQQSGAKLWFNTNLPLRFPANSLDRFLNGYVDSHAIVVFNPDRKPLWEPNAKDVVRLSSGRNGRLVLDKRDFISVANRVAGIFGAAVERGKQFEHYYDWKDGKNRDAWKVTQKPGAAGNPWARVVAAHGYGALT